MNMKPKNNHHQKTGKSGHHHHKKQNAKKNIDAVNAVEKSAPAAEPSETQQRFAEVDTTAQQNAANSLSSGEDAANAGSDSSSDKPEDCANVGCKELANRTIPEGMYPVTVSLQAGGVPAGNRMYDNLPLNDKMATETKVLNSVNDFIQGNKKQFQDVGDLVQTICSGPLCASAGGRVSADAVNDPFKSAFLPPGTPIDAVV